MTLNSDLFKGHGQASPGRPYNLNHSWCIISPCCWLCKYPNMHLRENQEEKTNKIK